MQELLSVMPMAFVMVAGPQVVTAIVLATGVRGKRDSAFFLAGAAAATTLGVTLAYRLTGLLRTSASRWRADDRVEHAVELAIIGLLLFLAWKVFRERVRTEPPRWMARLETATPLLALRIGFLLFLLMPGDLISTVTVGAYLAHHDVAWWRSLFFVVLTVFLAGVPLMFLLLLGKQAKVLLPKTRDWMTANSWIVSEIVIVLFLLMTLKDLLGA